MLATKNLPYSHAMFAAHDEFLMEGSGTGVGFYQTVGTACEPADAGRVVTTKRGSLAADLLQVQYNAIVDTIYNCRSARPESPSLAARWQLAKRRAGIISPVNVRRGTACKRRSISRQQLKPINE